MPRGASPLEFYAISDRELFWTLLYYLLVQKPRTWRPHHVDAVVALSRTKIGKGLHTDERRGENPGSLSTKQAQAKAPGLVRLVRGVEALLRAKDRAGLFKVLGRYMRAHGYKYTRPRDKTVQFVLDDLPAGDRDLVVDKRGYSWRPPCSADAGEHGTGCFDAK